LPTLTDTSLATPLLERPRGLAVAAGLLLAAPVLVSGWVASMPLPILGWAAAFLFLAVERDVHCQRIPNWLTFPAFAAALLYAGGTGGAEGALRAASGAGAALALLLLPYSLGALGAGDVKAAMVLGAGFGAASAAQQLLLAIAFGAVFAALRVAAQGELLELAKRWLHGLAATLATRRFVYFPPQPDAAAARGIPFAVALALAVATQSLLERAS
jgi:prepilin peptidase CpaA